MIRVAQLIYSDKVMRGADVLVVDLVRVQLRTGRVEPLVIAAASADYARLLGRHRIPCQLLPSVHPNRLNYLRVYASLLRAAPDVDVVHAHGARALYLAVVLRRLSRRWAGIALVYTVHDEWRNETRRQQIRSGVERWHCRRVDALIACSGPMLPSLRRVPGPRQVALIRNGLDPAPLSRPLDLHFPPGTPVVGSIGRLARQKRIDVFLDVAARLCAVSADVRFVVAGNGPERRALELRAARQGLAGRVRFLGEVDDVAALCAALAVLVQTSDHEGTPVVLLEAMATGTAIVATAVGGVPDLITSGEHGLLAPAGDVAVLAGHVAALLQDPAARARLGAAARARLVTDFGMEAMAERLASVYTAATDPDGDRGTGTEPAPG